MSLWRKPIEWIDLIARKICCPSLRVVDNEKAARDELTVQDLLSSARFEPTGPDFTYDPPSILNYFPGLYEIFRGGWSLLWLLELLILLQQSGEGCGGTTDSDVKRRRPCGRGLSTSCPE